MFDTNKFRKDFPILNRMINNQPPVYLDSPATALKPQSVIDAVLDYYRNYSANIYRGLYKISEKATENYESARAKVARFIGAEDSREVIFVRNATEAINLVVFSWGTRNIDKNSEIITTVTEHHANLVPWQQLALGTGAKIKYLDIDNQGYLKIDSLEKLITGKTKIFALSYVSNVLGTINPVKKIIRVAKRINPKIKILIDAAQAVPHIPIDVADLNCDFLVFSGHKMLGPTGIGVLWGKFGELDAMLPYMFGGEMIEEVNLEQSTFKKPPLKFEAGTPNIAGAIGLSAAIDYLEKVGWERLLKHENNLLEYAMDKFSSYPDITIYGPENLNDKVGIISFNIEGIHPHDLSQVLDKYNVCIRAGHHCAMPLHTRLCISSSARASFYLYNNKQDVDKLNNAIRESYKIFRT